MDRRRREGLYMDKLQGGGRGRPGRHGTALRKNAACGSESIGMRNLGVRARRRRRRLPRKGGPRGEGPATPGPLPRGALAARRSERGAQAKKAVHAVRALWEGAVRGAHTVCRAGHCCSRGRAQTRGAGGRGATQHTCAKGMRGRGPRRAAAKGARATTRTARALARTRARAPQRPRER
ncbi:MAG: hypothetical protein J3K34DRAFT_244457 [Monoraphidium minutum]|nr:MAG: hypothetical protein J3K34DRAFT_244457 [Monoraphidium minutum]